MSNPAEAEREHEGQRPAEEPAADGTRSVPESPTALPRRRWPAVFKRTFKSYQADNVGDLAAALTYYGIQAIFPALIALVSIIGLIGPSATKALISNLEKLAPGTAQHIFTNAIYGLQSSRGTAGILFIVGLGGALWSASGYISAFTRAANTIYGV